MPTLKSVLVQVQRRGEAILLRGGNVECLLCGWTGTRFAKADRCPRCRSLPRNRLVPIVFAAAGLRQIRRCVLVGANPLEVRFIAGRSGVAIPLDLRPREGQVAGDLCRLPLADNSIDLFFAWHVLEHIPDDRTAMAAMFQATRIGGNALICVPVTPPWSPTTWEDPATPKKDRKAVYGHPDHVRRPGLDYGRRLSDAGFIVREFIVRDHVSPEDRNRFGLRARDVVWIGTKLS